jgi:hypothetical protein
MITIYMLGLVGIFCMDGIHDYDALKTCKEKPQKLYAGSTLGCDVRIEGVDVHSTEAQLKYAINHPEKYKLIYCKGFKK